MISIKTEKTITPMVLCETSTIWACTSFGLTGHCASGGGFGGRFGSGCRLESSCGVSNQDSIGSRNGKRHLGSFPLFWTLLGINLSGNAAKISLLTWNTVIITASTTRPRRPFIFRNKNLNKSPIGSSWLHHSGSIWIILGNTQRWSAADTGDGQVDIACCRINGDGVRFMANHIVA